ncbi:prepilin-type N-terminal cleavage/methylation domain-containing protein [Opitutaceae bacterium TAV1]|nr:prepilin-type N-terminal cleavage/methylation domain-containing protein [Opitutaceae bacterium TAV1]
MNHTHTTRRHAFTLIELLTVIAIIGILAAIIIPVVGRVRASARAAQCLSNMRQTGAAAQLWSADNKGFIIPAYDATSEVATTSLLSWMGMLAPYAGWQKPDPGDTKFLNYDAIPDVFKCALSPKPTPAGEKPLGFAQNLRYLSGKNPGWPFGMRTYAQAAHPSTTVFMAESDTFKTFVGAPDTVSWGWPQPEYRHPGNTCNVLWLDGHVSGEKESNAKLKDAEYWKLQ